MITMTQELEKVIEFTKHPLIQRMMRNPRAEDLLTLVYLRDLVMGSAVEIVRVNNYENCGGRIP